LYPQWQTFNMSKNRLNSIEVMTWFQAGWAELRKGVSEERRQI